MDIHGIYALVLITRPEIITEWQRNQSITTINVDDTAHKDPESCEEQRKSYILSKVQYTVRTSSLIVILINLVTNLSHLLTRS